MLDLLKENLSSYSCTTLVAVEFQLEAKSLDLNSAGKNLLLAVGSFAVRSLGNKDPESAIRFWRMLVFLF